ncbi:MAG TPA: O-antigen ligase family protein [Candidatus Dormibacteraeota bacterium]|nr:O-antigen ligase family protein [Candidatus Dormibacteraeota bacterium]
MRLSARQWAIVALGAGAALPVGVRVPYAATGTLPIDVLVWTFLVVTLVLTGNREWKGLRRDAVARLLVAYLAASAASLPIGIAAYHNTTGVRSYLYGVAIVANFAAGYLILRGTDDVKLVLRAFVASIGVVSIGLNIYLLQSGILENPHSFHNSRFITTLVYGWPNAFSVLLVIAALMAVYFLLTATTTPIRIVYGVLAASLAVCLILTFSKTGWVSAAVAAWVLLLRFWSWRRQLALVGFLLAAGVGLYFVGNESLRMQLFTIETLTERFTIVADVFRYTNPLYILVGSGSQPLETLLRAHANVQIAPTVGLATLSPHDEFVNVLVKGGIASLVLFVAALVVVMLRLRRVVRQPDGLDSMLFRYWQAASWAVIASLFTGEELRYWPLAAAFWLVAGASVHHLPPRPTALAARADRQRTAGTSAAVTSKPLG